MDLPEKKLLIILLGAGLVLRLVYVIFFAPPLNVPSGDAVGYDLLGWNIVQYHQLAYEKDKPTAHREPGYPLFLALIYFLFGHNILVARIFQALVGVASCYLIYLLCREIFSQTAAFLSLIIAVVWPAFIYYTASLLRETFFTFLLLMSIFLFQRGKIFLLGVFLALLSLTNSIAILLAFVCGIVILFRRHFRSAFVFLVMFCLIYGFWPLRNYLVFKTIVFGSTNAGATFLDGIDIIPWEIRGLPQEEEYRQNHSLYVEARKISGEIERNNYYIQQVINYIKANPVRYFFLVVKKYFKLWNFYPKIGASYGHSGKLLKWISILSYGPVFLLAVAGLFIFPWSKIFSLLLPLFIFPVVYAFFWAQIRYRIPLEPYLIILASGTIVYLKGIFFAKGVKE